MSTPDSQVDTLIEQPTTLEFLSRLTKVHFCARLLRKGDPYGLDMKLVHDADEPLVEFYDSRYPHTIYGQFVSRYKLSTLEKMVIESPGSGLDLYGGEADWKIAAADIVRVLKALAPKDIAREQAGAGPTEPDDLFDRAPSQPRPRGG